MKTPPIHSSQRHAGFSLMELLLAIAILAVLVTLSLTVTQNLRTKSDDVACLSNLRQSGQAILSYLHDHNGRFLPKKYWFQYSSYRANANQGMREYFKVEPDGAVSNTNPSYWVDTMLTCPAMLRKYPGLKQSMFRRGYGINYFLFLTADGKEISGFKNLRAVPNPAAMWAIGDAAVGQVNNPNITEPLGSMNDNTAYHSNEYVPYPHSGKRQQFFFLDGHVEGFTKPQLRNVRSQREFWGNTTFND